MSKQATFDPAKRLDLYFRCNRAGSKDFVFTYSNGSAYSFIYQEFTFNIYRNQGERKVLITLPLVYASNTLTASITKSLSNINEGEYYYELYNTDTEETWLCGDANFHNGKFDGVNADQNSVTVSIDGETIAITLEVTPASSSQNSATWGSITGTLSDQTDLQTVLSAKANTSSLGSAAFEDTSAFDSVGAAAAAQAASQPVDTDLTAIAGLAPSNGDFLYRESGAWVNKTTTQVKTILGVSLMPYAADSPNTSITGTTSQTTWVSIPIPAGTILAGDIIRIKVFISKTGTAGSLTNRIVFNTTNDLSGSPITVGMWNAGGISAIHSIKAFREIFVNTLTVQYMSNVLTANAVTDDGSFTFAATLPGIDFTVDQYLQLTAQLSNTGDVGILRGYTIEILR